MYTVKDQLDQELSAMRRSGLYKDERRIHSTQNTHLVTSESPEQAPTTVLNFCANNYLGLADDPRLVAAAKSALDERGLGMASVRFICGTQDIHLDLERLVSTMLGVEDTVLFPSCFDANGGVFASLLDHRDAVVSDSLNHASIIDGIRLSKAQRFRYANRDLDDLRTQLHRSRNMNDGAGPRRTLIVTDGVFSMDGYLAPLPEICTLAEEFGALVMVDDSHAVGIMGRTGAGTPEHFGVSDRVDICTGTFGKALGGASGGYVAGPAGIIQVIRQRARPYLFSNSMAPAMVGAAAQALELVATATEPRRRLHENAALFRRRMGEEGFELLDGDHPIIAVMFHDPIVTSAIAEDLMLRGVYVTSFSHPVVPHGEARIRVQISSSHTSNDIETCVRAFGESRRSVLSDQSHAPVASVQTRTTTESERP